MKYDKNKINNSNIQENFIWDSIRQLKSGLSINLFNEEQIKVISTIVKEKYNMTLKIEYDEFCYTIHPNKKIYKHTNF